MAKEKTRGAFFGLFGDDFLDYSSETWGEVGSVGTQLVKSGAGAETEALGYMIALASGDPVALVSSFIADITGNIKMRKEAEKFERKSKELRKKGQEAIDQARRKGRFTELKGLYEKQESILKAVNSGFMSGMASFAAGGSTRADIESNKNVSFERARFMRSEGKRVATAYEEQAKESDKAAKEAREASRTWIGIPF